MDPDCSVCKLSIKEENENDIFILPYPQVTCSLCGLSFCGSHSTIHSDTFCVWQSIHGTYGILPNDWNELT